MPVPLQQAIVVLLSTLALALVTIAARRTARGPRRLLAWIALWLALAPPVGLFVWLVNRGSRPEFARAALQVQIAGAAMAAVLAWLGAGEG